MVPGGFGSRGTDGKIAAAEWARTKRIPYLGKLHHTCDNIKWCMSIIDIQVLAIDFVLFAEEFIAFVIEFSLFAIKFSSFAIEFVS